MIIFGDAGVYVQEVTVLRPRSGWSNVNADQQGTGQEGQ